MQKTGIEGMDKNELRALVYAQRDTIHLLLNELKALNEDDGLSKAIINVNTSSLNMRQEPSLESEVLIRIPNGSRVSILYFDEEQLFLEGAMGQWCKIKYADQEGWVWGNYLQLE